MGNFSRDDTFNPDKHYVSVRLQQGVPVIDSDWNELQDIRKHELETFLKWFVPLGNEGFGIHADGNDFSIAAGHCLVEGWTIVNEGVLNYAEQAGAPALTTPSSDRIDTVYVDIWEREVNAEEDPEIVNPDIGVETCVRTKREWMVRVAEGATELPKPEPGHLSYPLATLSRKAGQDVIDGVTDLRRTGLTLAGAPLRIPFKYNDPKGGLRLCEGEGAGDYWDIRNVSHGLGFDYLGATKLLVQYAGNVGIGTATPSQRLEIHRGNIIIDRLAANNDSLYVGSGGIGGDITPGSSGGAQIEFQNIKEDAHSSQTIHFLTHHVGVSHARRMTIDKDGNVGIGTTSPNAKLDVRGHLVLEVGGDPAIYGGTGQQELNRYVQLLNSPGYGSALGLKAGGVLVSDNYDYASPGKNDLVVRGQIWAQQYNPSGGDYAEYFESLNGREIPVGVAVALDSEKVRPARKDEVPIGIVSANPGIVGGAYREWPEKYLRDELGNPIMEEYEEEVMASKKKMLTRKRRKMTKKTVEEEVTRTEVVRKGGKYRQKEITETVTREVEEPDFDEVDLYDETGKTVIGKHRVPAMETQEEEIDILDDDGRPILVGTGKFETKERPKLNPDYDELKEYVPREKRPEWNCVGLLGKLPLLKGQPVADSWIKMKDLSDEVELWLVK